jgi:hypothetical protein
VSYRKYRAIELADFASDIESTITFHSEEMPLDDLVRNYNDSIRAAADKHAPVQTKVVTLRTNTQWYSQELHAVKKDKRDSISLAKSASSIARYFLYDTVFHDFGGLEICNKVLMSL